MNILVIGSGGREHALAWKINGSPKVDRVFCSPGNAGTATCAENVAIDLGHHAQVVDFCRENAVELVVIGPEAPLAVGISDDLEKAGISVFGPSYAASRLESSKIFAKELMGRYDIPTASFRIFDDYGKAAEHIRSRKTPLVVKAYGLAAGKGVIIADTTDKAVEAAEAMLVRNEFGTAGQKIIVEDFLEGEEASILVVTDGKTIIPLATSQDHKRAGEGDTGPNTGGMGAYSPAPVIDGPMMEEIMESVIRPTISGLSREGITYRGVLYAGIMITADGPRVLEYNVRFGDPETQAVLPRIKSDLVDVLAGAARGELEGTEIEWDERECVCVVLASGGYPGPYEKGKEIKGIGEAIETGAYVFHAGTAAADGRTVTSGGRVLNVAALGSDIREAVDNVYEAVGKIEFDGMYYRKDIGHRALARFAG